MAVGLPAKTTYVDGDVFSASDINDTNGTINLIGQTNNFYAGKNRIINGDFGVWQRGTSFSNPASGSYLADRFYTTFDGTGATRTISQQTFTPGTAPVSGYEGQFFLRYAKSVAGLANVDNVLYQKIEDVRTLAGQTVTLSFWAKSAGTTVIKPYVVQGFGSGGSGDVVVVSLTPTFTTSTSWQRFTTTFTFPSLSGKTVGTSSSIAVGLDIQDGTTFTVDFWGIQLEAGSTATAFETATGTIQGELAACQRYYYRQSSATGNEYAHFAQGLASSTSQVNYLITTPVTLRIPSSVLDYANLAVYDGVTVTTATSSAIIGQFQSPNTVSLRANTAGGATTAYRPYFIIANNSSSAYIGISAEL
jgi:hypothetical protein